jgi:hypothetical protein
MQLRSGRALQNGWFLQKVKAWTVSWNLGINVSFSVPFPELLLIKGKSATCFYVRFQEGEGRLDDFHTALFLKERTAQYLRTKISQKRNFSQDLEVDLFQVKANGLKIRIDDDVVRQIPNNQALSAEISRPLASDDSTEGKVVSGTIEVKISF